MSLKKWFEERYSVEDFFIGLWQLFFMGAVFTFAIGVTIVIAPIVAFFMLFFLFAFLFI
jgi:hypothetical protein